MRISDWSSDVCSSDLPGGSLFSGGEIYRAVRTGQAPIGERLISALGNEDPLFEIDALPFLATSFDDAWKLYQASKPELEETLDAAGLKLLYTVAWPTQGPDAKEEKIGRAWCRERV